MTKKYIADNIEVTQLDNFPLTPASLPTSDYQIANKLYIDNTLNGWIDITSTPTFTSTTNGVDTISFAGVDVTDKFVVGRYVKCSSTAGSDLIYKVKSATFSTNTTVELVGETSVSGTITAISYALSENVVQPWESLLTARAYLSSNLENVTGATFFKIDLDAESYDINGDFDVVTNNRYDVPVSGYYRVTPSISYWGKDINDQAAVRTNLYKNGTSIRQSILNISGAGDFSASTTNEFTDKVYLNRGDYLELYGYIDNGDNLADIFATETFMIVEFAHV